MVFNSVSKLEQNEQFRLTDQISFSFFLIFAGHAILDFFGNFDLGAVSMLALSGVFLGISFVNRHLYRVGNRNWTRLNVILGVNLSIAVLFWLFGTSSVANLLIVAFALPPLLFSIKERWIGRILLIPPTLISLFFYLERKALVPIVPHLGLSPMSQVFYLVTTTVLIYVTVLHYNRGREKSELELRDLLERVSESESRFQLLANHIDAVIWLAQPDSSEVHYLSPAYERIWGSSPEELRVSPRKWMENIHPDDLPLVHQAMETALTRDTEVEFRIRHPDGSTRWIADRFFRVLDVNGKLSRLCGVCTDITAQKEADQVISDQRVTIAASAKMSALGEMAGGIAHEINNPLGAIQLFCEQMQDSLKNDKTIDRAWLYELSDNSLKTVERISKIVKGLRAFSRDGSGDSFTDTSVQEIINNTLVISRARFKSHGIDLQCDIPVESSRLECRSVQISQVLLNLLGNSMDAIEDLKEKWVRLMEREVGDFVEISVTDSGKGIPKETRERLFQPFFSTKVIGKGTGLGLSISKGIIESHHGTLTIDEKCENTRFVVRLPKTQAIKLTREVV